MKVRAANLSIAVLGSLFVLSVPCFSQQQDVTGWERVQWGMSNQELVKAVDRITKLPKSELFLGLHVDYIIPEFKLVNEQFTVFFQLSDTSNKLSQILIRLNEQTSSSPRENIFRRLESALVRKHGKPLDQIDERHTSVDNYTFINLTRLWRFPGTTIELSYGWDNQINASLLTVRYFPPNQRMTNKLLNRTA
jgi:hypothetical protein